MYNYWAHDNSDALEHHGIKGQKWGIRRYQNKDGSWTREGLYRRTVLSRTRNAARTFEATNDIIRTLDDRKREQFGMRRGEKQYLSLEDGDMVYKRLLTKCGKVPVSFLDILTSNKYGTGIIALATREGYEGKGYANANVKKAIEWAQKHKKLVDTLEWGVLPDNLGSVHLAKKYGFEFDPNKIFVDSYGVTWHTYTKKVT